MRCDGGQGAAGAERREGGPGAAEDPGKCLAGALPIANGFAVNGLPGACELGRPGAGRLNDEGRHDGGGFECSGHAFASEWFDVAGSVANEEYSFGGDLARMTRERRRTSPSRGC